MTDTPTEPREEMVNGEQKFTYDDEDYDVLMEQDSNFIGEQWEAAEDYDFD